MVSRIINCIEHFCVKLVILIFIKLKKNVGEKYSFLIVVNSYLSTHGDKNINVTIEMFVTLTSYVNTHICICSYIILINNLLK